MCCLLRDPPERLDARHETGLAGLVGPEPSELLDVSPGDVQEDRLGRVVQVESRGDIVRLDVARGAVTRVRPKRATVAAGDRFGVHGHDLVHRVPNGLLVGEDPMLDPELRAKPARVLDPQGPVRCDALVNRDADQLDVAAVLEKPREEGGRGARVLSAAQPDRDAFSTPQVDLGSEFALHAPLDEIEKVLPAEMVCAGSNPLDRGSDDGRGSYSE